MFINEMYVLIFFYNNKGYVFSNKYIEFEMTTN